MDRYVLYYNSLRPNRPISTDEEETLTSNETTQHDVPTKPVAKLKKKKHSSSKKSEEKKKAKVEDAVNECELEGLLVSEPIDENYTDDEKASDGEDITICVNCQPLVKFPLQVPKKRLVENLMKEIEEKVLSRVRKQINVLKLSIGESEVKKALPPEFEISGLLDDGEEVFVEFTTENLERNVKSFHNSVSSEDKPRQPLVCPFKFTSLKELKQHLANSRVKIQLTKRTNWKPNKKGEYRCPLTFYNEEDSSRHIQEGLSAKLELIEPDLRTFWERMNDIPATSKTTATTIESFQEKAVRELIEEEEEEKMRKEQKEQKERDKKKKQKERQQSKKKEIIDKENRIRELKEQKELQEKEMKELKEKQKQIRKRALDVKKDMKSLVLEIVSFAESLIERKEKEKEKEIEQKIHERSLSPGTSRANRKKKKKADKEQTKKVSDPVSEVKNSSQQIPESSSKMEIIQAPKVNGNHVAPTPTVLVNGYSNGKPLHSRTILTLNQEIDNYLLQIKPLIDAQSALTVSMTNKILQVANSLWENASLKVYGSFATSLAIPSSDLDLVILGARSEGEAAFNLFAKELKQQSWVKSLQVIETAKVPVIKVTSIDENIPTDIRYKDSLSSVLIESFDGALMPTFATLDGLLVQHPVEFINGFVSKFPDIRNLAILLKQLLYERSLNNAYTGGLSSYCLVVMIISFFQAQQPNGNAANKKSLGELLLEFLEYYGKKFDNTKFGIQISHGGGLFSLDQSVHKFASPLVIVDPFNPANNISQNVTGFSKVKALFEEIHTALTSPFYLTFTPVVILERMLKKL